MKGQTAETKLRSSMDKRTFLDRLAVQGVPFPFPWMVVSTRELAALFEVELQTIHNWAIRGKGPRPVRRGIWRGNRRYYCVADIIAWFECKPVWEVYRDWVLEKFTNVSVADAASCEEFVNDLINRRVYKQPRWKLKNYSRLPLVSLMETQP